MQEEAGLKMHPSAFLSDLEAADKTFNGKFWKVKCGFFFRLSYYGMLIRFFLFYKDS